MLTCGPRPNVYSLYGHTAIRFQNKSNGTDIAINYGIFSFDKPFFILRFVFGLTDYEMGIEYFSDFVSHYSASGCGIRQQTLNLTNEEKAAIAAAIDKNYAPENRVYRYNYFYDNCTTRARDILISHIKGSVIYIRPLQKGATFRSMIHQYNETHRWARFGNDLLLGIKADRPTDRKEQQFLPQNLCKDFSSAYIQDKNGNKRKLVTSETWVLPHTTDVGSDKFPVSPITCMALIAIIITAASILEYIKNTFWWWIDAIIMGTTGICGLILLAMIFSKHPTVSLNLQILLLNPITLFCAIPAIKGLKKRKITSWIRIWEVLIVMFIIGGYFQSYAEGMYFVALSLLLRYILKTIQFNKAKQNKS